MDRLTTVTRHPALLIAMNATAGPTFRAKDLQPGDFILVHSYGRLAPRLISFGQRLHHDPAFAYFTHAALYVGLHPTNERGSADEEWLIEAKGGQKVRPVPLSQYDVRDYAAVRFSEVDYDEKRLFLPEMRRNAVAFAESQLGHGYAYFSILNVAIWTLFGGRFTFGVSGENFCSGLVASALTRLGETFDGEPGTQEPADLAAKYNVRK